MFANLKKNLTEQIRLDTGEKVKSSHVSEAIAHALGYKTLASLKSSQPIWNDVSVLDGFDISLFLSSLDNYIGLKDIDKSSYDRIVIKFKSDLLPHLSDNFVNAYRDFLTDKKMTKDRQLPDQYVFNMFEFLNGFLEQGYVFSSAINHYISKPYYLNDFKDHIGILKSMKESMKKINSGMNFHDAFKHNIDFHFLCFCVLYECGDKNIDFKRFITKYQEYMTGENINNNDVSFCELIKNENHYNIKTCFCFFMALLFYQRKTHNLRAIVSGVIKIAKFNNIPEDSNLLHIMIDFNESIKQGLSLHDFVDFYLSHKQLKISSASSIKIMIDVISM